jgi:hypothetical protein
MCEVAARLSTGRPPEGTASQDVAVQVIHGLAAVGLAVDHEPGAPPGAAQFRSKLLSLKEDAPQKGLVPAFQFHDVPDVPFGDDQKMNRRLGRDIVKGQKLVIFVDLFGRNFTGRYFTKNTITHKRILSRCGDCFQWYCDRARATALIFCTPKFP